MKRKRHDLVSAAALLVLLAGLCVFFYPTVSDQLNRYRQAGAISDYVKTVEELDTAEYDRLLAEAEAYNEGLVKGPVLYKLTEEQREQYGQLLNAAGNGIMGTIDIPKVRVSLPIYHGSGEDTLNRAIGHLDYSSLPVGGTGTHTVITGHRGQPSARLFTDIDQLVPGDRFTIRVPGRLLTYEVDQILTVLPGEMEALAIDEKKDLCTLMTCTPYGVNTHRLLVRGHRVPNEEEEGVPYTAERVRLSPVLIIPLAAAPALLIVIIWLLVRNRRRKGKTE